jgi:probable HAF family extracellular repeat protein
MKKETMNKRLLRGLSYSVLFAMPIVTGTNALACGNSSITITNLPPQAGGGYQVFDMSQNGKLTGYFYNPVTFPHAFVYDSGAITDLGTLGGMMSIGLAINSAGQVVGQGDTNGETHAFLFNSGNLKDLGTLGGSYSSAAALNENGQVVGESYTLGDVGPIAFLYTNGPMVSLGTLGSNYSTAYAINNSGTVVGQSGVSSGDIHGFVYSGGVLTDVHTLGGTYSSAFEINDAGLVVGESSDSNSNTYAFIYMGGHMTNLGTLGGTYSSAFRVNTNNQVAGVANITNDVETHGFFYDHGHMTDLGTLGGTNTSVWALNNRGQIVGQSLLPDGTGHAYLWENGHMVDLNTLLPANSGWELINAQMINDAKRIVGYGNYAGSQQWFVIDFAAGDNPPVAVAGANQTVDCQAQVTLDGSASSDPDNDPLTYEWSLGSSVLGSNAVLTVSLPLGTNVVTLKVSDPCNATSQANVVVTVVDTMPPTGSCPTDMTAAADANCQAPVPDVASQVVASDNCTPTGLLKITQDPAAGTMVGLGPQPISIKVTDGSGNSSSCGLTFTVQDKTPPTMTGVPASVSVSAGDNCQGVVPNVLGGVVVSDTCTASNQLVLTQNPAAGTLIGTGPSTILVTAMDASGNSTTANVALTVADTTAPSILSVPAPLTVSTDANCQGTVPNVLPNVVAIDNCTPVNQLVLSQSPTAGTVLPAGPYVIVVSVSDLSGNSSTANVGLTITNNNPPVVRCVSATPNILNPPNHQMVPVTVSVFASGNCNGSLVSKIVSVASSEPVADGDIQVTGNLTLNLAASRNPSGPGRVYTITVQSTDAAGNASTATVTVTVPKGNGNGNGSSTVTVNAKHKN